LIVLEDGGNENVGVIDGSGSGLGALRGKGQGSIHQTKSIRQNNAMINSSLG